MTEIIMIGISHGEPENNISGCEARLTLETEYDLSKDEIEPEQEMMTQLLKEHLDDQNATILTERQWDEMQKQG